MYKSPLEKKLIDILGNQFLSSQQRSWALLDVLHKDAQPDEIPNGIKVILECAGLCPRHETKLECPNFEQSFIDRVESAQREKVDYHLKGWFEINVDRVEKNLIELCMFLEEFTDDKERAIVFQMVLASRYVPIPVVYFSKHTAEGSDDLILRAHAAEYIQMRQLLNLKVDATSRGSLLMDFVHSLQTEPHAQAVVLGSFIEDLLRRLKGQKGIQTARESSEDAPISQDSSSSSPSSEQAPNPFNFNSSATFPFSPDMDQEQLRDMMNNFKSMLPPDVLDQLRKMFGDEEPPKDI
jgi:hypothetical protein